MQAAFFAILSRMKYIQRWGLMHNTRTENLSEHTLEVAYLTHALLTLYNKTAETPLDVGKAVTIALYHDCSEIITGDLPTPVKYYNPEIKAAYKELEVTSAKKLLQLLPEELVGDYAGILLPEEDPMMMRLIKAADRLSALIKCLEEKKQGNLEFSQAYESIRKSLEEMELPVVDLFLREFLPAYSLTLDELGIGLE